MKSSASNISMKQPSRAAELLVLLRGFAFILQQLPEELGKKSQFGKDPCPLTRAAFKGSVEICANPLRPHLQTKELKRHLQV